MTTTDHFILRTEDIRSEDILGLFVSTERDLALISALKAPSPLIIEGSRGTGKSLLLRVCERQQLDAFEVEKILPVYISFIKSSLINTGNPHQFQHWMLARICSRIFRAFESRGLIATASRALQVLSGGGASRPGELTRLESIADAYEESFKNPGIVVEDSSVPEVEEFRDAVEDLCEAVGVKSLNLLFDEAAHIFRPEQQRQFFTMFRDLRSPYITCNAAVYPGVTVYGSSFETSHDARIESLHRDITDSNYLDQMRQIILKQADSELQRYIVQRGENFDALAFAVSGNPRLLLKTVAMAPDLKNTSVQTALKEFYRTTIWAEHSALAERFQGHKTLIDWGRTFLEETVIPETLKKNSVWRAEGKADRTCFFWLHRDAPQPVQEAFRLLTYTGIVNKVDSGIVATRREIGSRYAINIGCLAASESNPVTFITDLRKGITVKRFTEYGANQEQFNRLTDLVGSTIEADTSAQISAELKKSISLLDLSNYQKQALQGINIHTIGDALSSSEVDFQKAKYIGPIRSRKIMNVAHAAVLEYLSG